MLLALFLLAVITLATINNLNRPVNSDSERQPLVSINTDKLLWSGQEEGETVAITQNVVPTSPSKRYSLDVGLSESSKLLNGSVPLLPTLLPENTKYADVYVGPVVIIAYSSDPAADFRSSIIRFAVTLNNRGTPTTEQLNAIMRTGDELFRYGDIFGFVDPNATTGWNDGKVVIATFYIGNLHYIMTASPPVAKDDVLSVIQSMKP
jgi:hypothetical protein